MNDLNRRLALLGGAGLATVLASQQAKADTAFTSFAFPASGAPANRTMPVRLSEVINVKDWGAVGDGSTDDTAAIQAAINWTSDAFRGEIFFPPGTYKITSSLTWNPDN